MIRKLDPLISNKIAAGEVVERPAAVVKELVENALDAGATQITVEIREAGKSLIRVSDNGSGIALSDLTLAFERHATSKIASVEDIYQIATLGFRGEALASIASVSRVECITMTQDDQVGVRIFLNGGLVSGQEAIGTRVGTTFIIRDLFFNTPVRYKFLKSNQAEQAAIVDLVNKLALSHCQVSFTLIVDSREIYRTDGRGRLLNALLAIYGKSFIEHMILIESEEVTESGPIKIEGYVSRPTYSRGNRNYQMIFVNGRYVRSEELQRTVGNAYTGLTTIGQFPAFALHITMPYDQVDVNIHPAKTEIRFKEPMLIEGFVFTAVKQTLMNVDLTPKAKLDMPRGGAQEGVRLETNEGRSSDNQTYNNTGGYGGIQLVSRDAVNAPVPVNKPPIESLSNILDALDADFALPTENLPDVKLEPYIAEFYNASPAAEQLVLPTLVINKETLYDDLRIVGQLFNTYIVCERDQSAFLIDQHAAHERILFESFLNQFRTKRVDSQMLLVPFIYHGDAAQTYFQKNAVEWLGQLGVQIEPFGDSDWVIRAVPIVHGQALTTEAVSALIDGYHQYQTHVLEMASIEDIIRQSCKAAIKANFKLSDMEIMGLFNELKQLENPYTCPHGRPIIIELTNKEIEKRFKRT